MGKPARWLSRQGSFARLETRPGRISVEQQRRGFNWEETKAERECLPGERFFDPAINGDDRPRGF